MINENIQKLIGKPVKYNLLKRTFDLILAIILLIPFLILMVFFGILIKITSPGPIIYKQQRVGYKGKIFNIYKLRSMVNHAEENTGAIWAQKNDSRVTKLGHFMRKTRIDEIPQIFNILKGQMSWVGPRPERPQLTIKFCEKWPFFAERLRIVPGLTGLAQVKGGYDLTPDAKVKYDNQYIENWSCKLDIKIIFKTIITIFTGNGAR